MTSPAIRQTPPARTQAVNAQASNNIAPSTTANAEDNRDSAISDISTARAHRRRSRAPAWHRAADQVAQAYERGGRHAVNELLQRNPDIMRAVATGPADAIEDRMDAATSGYFDGGNALEVVEDFVNGAMRDTIATQAQRRIHSTIGATERLRNDILGNLDRYRNAAPDSAEGQALRALGLDSTSNAAQINKAVDHAIEGLEALSERFEGQAWESGDFPNSVRSASAQLRLRSRTGEETIADRVVEGQSGTAETVTALLGDAGHGIIEGVHLLGHAQLGTAALGLGVLAAGVALGVAIHHGAEEVRNEAIALAHELGI